MTSLGVSSTSDVISFDQNCHHLCSTTAVGRDLSNNTQIRVIGLMEPEICIKMPKKSGEKLTAKFPATTWSYSMVKIACVSVAFGEVSFICKQAQEKVNHCSKKKRKGIKKFTKIKKPKDVHVHVQCSSDISEPKYTRNTRQPNTRIRVYIYANTRIHIRKYAYTLRKCAYAYTRIRVYSVCAYASLVCMS